MDGPSQASVETQTQTGIDVLEATHFTALAQAAQRQPTFRLGLLTNQTGQDAQGRRTVDILATDLPKAVPQARLTTLFSPEHGIFGHQDTEHQTTETDPATGLHVTSLYGAHDSDRRPSHEQLKDLDAVLIDLQDAGVRFFTYDTVLGYFLEAAAHEKAAFHHELQIIVLDRPDPIGGLAVEGPVLDPGLESYINYMPLPARHGLTLGELARYINNTKQLHTSLTVVAMQHWQRGEFYDETGLPWINPSPNLRSARAEVTYPAVAFVEYTNLSVGRGTDTAFELFGAGLPTPSHTPSPAPNPGAPSASGARVSPSESPISWFHAEEVAQALNGRNIPGVRFEPTHTAVAEDANHYPFHGQTIEAVRLVVTDRTTFNSPETGAELLSVLHRLYPTQFQLQRVLKLVASKATLDAITQGDDPRSIAAAWQPALDRYREQRQASLLY